MSPAPKKRSTILVAVGACVFVLGTGLAALATRGDGGSSPSSAPVTTTTTIPDGLVAAATTPAPPTFVIPKGKQALPITLPLIAGGGGYVKPGDHVNIYGVFKNAPANNSMPNPIVKLVLADVKVLTVTSPAPPADGGNATYVLEVTANEAEQIIYLQNMESSYMTLARDDQGQVTTEGHGPKNEV